MSLLNFCLTLPNLYPAFSYNWMLYASSFSISQIGLADKMHWVDKIGYELDLRI